MNTKNLKSQRKIVKISIDEDLCIGAAPCVVISPKAFYINSKNKAEVKPGFIKCSDDELIIAAQSCPVRAIKLFDKKGRQVFP